MSKVSMKALWEAMYGNLDRVRDYTGRIMLKAAIGDPNSKYHPTIDHVRPLAQEGRNVKENIVICHAKTNEEKGDSFPCWNANGKNFRAEKVKGKRFVYSIKEIQNEKTKN